VVGAFPVVDADKGIVGRRKGDAFGVKLTGEPAMACRGGRVNQLAATPRLVGAVLGEHTDAVLGEAELDTRAIVQLRAEVSLVFFARSGIRTKQRGCSDGGALSSFFYDSRHGVVAWVIVVPAGRADDSGPILGTFLPARHLITRLPRVDLPGVGPAADGRYQCAHSNRSRRGLI
jgi:hypothetical protein